MRGSNRMPYDLDALLRKGLAEIDQVDPERGKRLRRGLELFERPHSHKSESAEGRDLRAEYEDFFNDEVEKNRWRESFTLACDLATLGPIEWAVDDLIPLDGHGMIYGAKDVFKTFLGYSLSTVWTSAEDSTTERHGDWMGFGCRTDLGVLYIDQEAGSDRSNRVWLAANAAGLSKPSARFAFRRHGPFNLLAESDVNDLIAFARRLPFQVQTFFFDTVARVTPGAPENEAGTMTEALAKADRLEAETGGRSILLHHETKAGGSARGSSALPDGVAWVIHVRRVVGDPYRITLTVEHQRYAEKFKHPVELRLVERSIDVGGQPVKSLCVARADKTLGSSGTTTNKTDAQALTILAALPVGTTKREWKATCIAAGMPQNSFYNAFARLTAADGPVSMQGNRCFLVTASAQLNFQPSHSHHHPLS